MQDRGGRPEAADQCRGRRPRQRPPVRPSNLRERAGRAQGGDGRFETKLLQRFERVRPQRDTSADIPQLGRSLKDLRPNADAPQGDRRRQPPDAGTDDDDCSGPHREPRAEHLAAGGRAPLNIARLVPASASDGRRAPSLVGRKTTRRSPIRGRLADVRGGTWRASRPPSTRSRKSAGTDPPPKAGRRGYNQPRNRTDLPRGRRSVGSATHI